MTPEKDRDGFLDILYGRRPHIHRGETEVSRHVSRSESFLDDRTWNAVPWAEGGCHGIERDLADFLDNTLCENWHTLETGSGISTLIFARRRTLHIAVTPNAEEFDNLKRWGSEHSLDLSRVTFVSKASEDYLPTYTGPVLDCVFIDGKHAFPWPIIDWFFCARHLRRNGMLILDDIDMASVSILTDFLSSESGRWQVLSRLERSICFQKLTDSIEDVAWHMQPFVARRNTSLVRRIMRRAKRALKRFQR